MDAARLIDEIAAELQRPSGDLIALFGNAPVDFQLRVVGRLPLMAHLFGMRAITLFGRVWMLESTSRMAPRDLLSLVRHEAEHVRQQRRHPLSFYPRYAASWLVRFFTLTSTGSLLQWRQSNGRFYAAYRTIPFEEEAFGAGRALLSDLDAGRPG